MYNITWTRLLMTTGLLCVTAIAYGAPMAAASQGDAKLAVVRSDQDPGGADNTPGVEPAVPAGIDPANLAPQPEQPGSRAPGTQPAAPESPELVTGPAAGSPPNAAPANSKPALHHRKCHAPSSTRYVLQSKHHGCRSKHHARRGKPRGRDPGGDPDGVLSTTRS